MSNPEYINKILSKLKTKHPKVIDFSKECPVPNPYPISRRARRPSEYYKMQIDDLTNKYFELVESKKCADERYKQILNELNYLYKLIENKSSCDTSSSSYIPMCSPVCNQPTINQQPIIYSVPTGKEDEIIVTDPNAKFAIVNMVGGGGAGGIGYVNNQYYYGGGGGGGAASLVSKPIPVTVNTIITIYIGKGGSQVTGQDGEASYAIFKYPDNKILTFKVNGGMNGHPLLSEIINLSTPRSLNTHSRDIQLQDMSVDGGGCGMTTVWAGIQGQPGIDGIITIPSQIPAIGSPGGASAFGEGGLGGMNNYDHIIGQNGTYGSGGGGSAPQLVIDETNVSGNGGDGLVTISFI